MREPNRNDILLAIWSALALSEAEDVCLGTDLGEEALHELFDDLHADLLHADPLLDDDFDEYAIAAG